MLCFSVFMEGRDIKWSLKAGEARSICGIRSEVSLSGWMITPPNMKKGQKYAVLFSIYGGPGHQMVTKSWGGALDMWHQIGSEPERMDDYAAQHEKGTEISCAFQYLWRAGTSNGH